MKKKIIKFLLFITQIPVSALIAPQVVLSDAAFKQHLLCPTPALPSPQPPSEVDEGRQGTLLLIQSQKAARSQGLGGRQPWLWGWGEPCGRAVCRELEESLGDMLCHGKSSFCTDFWKRGWVSIYQQPTARILTQQWYMQRLWLTWQELRDAGSPPAKCPESVKCQKQTISCAYL